VHSIHDIKHKLAHPFVGISTTMAKFIDLTTPEAAAAEQQVAEEYEISDTLCDRLVAIREDL
jgi:hypothetical protein